LHTEAGFTAIDLTCTHLGCSVVPEEGRLVCPCHGSIFGVNGEVLNGPSKAALNSFPVVVTEAGNLIIQKTERG
jgi:Rieske Fe-S protein